MARRFLLTVSLLSALGVLLLGGALLRSCSREAPYTPPAPSAPKAPGWTPQKVESTDAGQGPKDPVVERFGVAASEPSEAVLPLEIVIKDVPGVPEDISRPSSPIEEEL